MTKKIFVAVALVGLLLTGAQAGMAAGRPVGWTERRPV